MTSLRLSLFGAVYAFLMAALAGCAPLSDPDGLFLRETARTAITSTNAAGPF